MNAMCAPELKSSHALSSHFAFRCAMLLILLFAAVAVADAETVTVPAGGDFQKALDEANPGDTIQLTPGTPYVGPFILRNRGTQTDTAYITIQSSELSQLPADSTRVSPSDTSHMPKIVAPGNNQNALRTEPYAHHYRFIGIEFAPQSASAVVTNIIWLGDVGGEQDSLEEVPHHLTFDRCYIHAYPTQDVRRAVALNSKETTIINSYISEIHSRNGDAQAIWGWNGPGPYHIINNYLESSGECLGFGGSVPSIQGVVPSDIEIRRNHLAKPISWRGQGWVIKQLFELKCGKRVVVEGNLMEYNWVESDQQGYAIGIAALTEGGSVPWYETQAITIRNNIIRHAGGGINIYGKDGSSASHRVTDVVIANNLFDDISNQWDGEGNFLKLSNAEQIVVDHNTILQTGMIIFMWTVSSSEPKMPGFVMTNNIIEHHSYGILGNGYGEGNVGIAAYFSDGIILKNVLAGANQAIYPQPNFYPPQLDDVKFVDRANGNYRLASNSPYKGLATDDKDVGCDFDALDAALNGTTGALASPTNLSITFSNSSTQMVLVWTASNGAHHYQIERRGKNEPYQVSGTSSTPNFIDTGVTGGKSYLYRVRAVDAAGNTSASTTNVHLGTAVGFEPLVVGVTQIKAVHMTGLRDAVNAVRDLANLPMVNNWIGTGLSGVNIQAGHITELRQKLAEALIALGLPSVAYNETVSPGTPIRKTHFDEVRKGVNQPGN